MVYEKNEIILRNLFKSATFVVQAICFKDTGKYVSRQKDLLKVVSSEDGLIVETFLKLKNGGAVDFDNMSEVLFDWAKKHIG